MSPVLAVLFAAMLGLMALPHLMNMQQAGLDTTRMAATGQQFTQMLDAAQSYVLAHSDTLEASVPVGSTGSVSVAALQGDSLLPANFNNANPFGQNWTVQVRQTSTGILQTVVTSNGGLALTAKQEAFIASIAGARGGFVPYDGMFNSLTSGSAQGAYGSWAVPLASYSNPGSGHLAGLLSFNNGNLQNNYLYRVGIPNHPELNTMTVCLNMGGNSISNANDVQANTGTFAAGNPGGRPGSVDVGGSYLYGDSTNLSARVNGGLYAQHFDGTPADIHGGNLFLSDRIGIQGYDADSGYPVGWAGGVHAWDVFAEGSLGAGRTSTGGPMTYFSYDGDGTVGNTLEVKKDALLDGITSIGTEIRLPANASTGGSCSPNGAMRANANGSGQPMFCYNGYWSSGATAATESFYTLPNAPGSTNGDATGMNLGQHFYCALNDSFEMNPDDPGSQPNATRVQPVSTDAQGRTTWLLSRGNRGGQGGQAACIDY